MTESENNFFIRPLALSEAHLASSSEREALANEAWSEEGIIEFYMCSLWQRGKAARLQLEKSLSLLLVVTSR